MPPARSSSDSRDGPDRTRTTICSSALANTYRYKGFSANLCRRGYSRLAHFSKPITRFTCSTHESGCRVNDCGMRRNGTWRGGMPTRCRGALGGSLVGPGNQAQSRLRYHQITKLMMQHMRRGHAPNFSMAERHPADSHRKLGCTESDGSLKTKGPDGITCPSPSGSLPVTLEPPKRRLRSFQAG